MNKSIVAIHRIWKPKLWREVFLTVGALLGTACILATISATVFGVKPLVFTSGSMSPAISTGALAFSKQIPAPDVKVGDIVSVVNATGTRITHRVQKVSLTGNSAMLTLKGDANKVPDAERYVVTSADRVLFGIPKAGYVVSWVAGPAGVFAGGLFVGLLLMIAFAPGSRINKSGGNRSSVAIAVVALGVCAVGAAGGRPTLAAFNDTANVVSGTFSASTLAAPATFTCSANNGNRVTFNWSLVAGATSYTLFYESGTKQDSSPGPTTTSVSENPLPTGTYTAWIVAKKNFGSTTWTSVQSTTRTYVVGSNNTCT